MGMPSSCQKCKFFKKHFSISTGLDYSYSCILGAKDFPMPWIRQMEERASDCPIEPAESQTGHWIEVTNGRGGHECDLCHEYAPSYQSGDEYLTKYCPNCGAKMESEGHEIQSETYKRVHKNSRL